MLPSGRAARIQARELCIAAQGAFRNGDVDKAITSYEQAVKVDNQCKESYIGLAAALTSQERFAEAAKHLRVALKLDPSYIVAQFDMGSLCHRQGNLGEATRYYNRVLRLARDQGLNIAEVSSGAETLRLLHDNAAASHALTLPGSAHRPPQNATEDAIIATRVNIGLVFLSTSRLEEAMRHFLSAIQLDSSRADVFTHLASCMYTMVRVHCCLRHYSPMCLPSPFVYELPRQLCMGQSVDLLSPGVVYVAGVYNTTSEQVL